MTFKADARNGKIKTNAAIGAKYGALEVIELVGSVKHPRKVGHRYEVMVKCRCKCGEVIVKNKRGLRDGNHWHCGNKQCKETRYEEWN